MYGLSVNYQYLASVLLGITAKLPILWYSIYLFFCSKVYNNIFPHRHSGISAYRLKNYWYPLLSFTFSSLLALSSSISSCNITFFTSVSSNGFMSDGGISIVGISSILILWSHHVGQLNVEGMSEYPHQGILSVTSFKTGQIYAD